MNGQIDFELVDQVKEALLLVIDPELGYNIVDLGLVYSCNITPLAVMIRQPFTGIPPGALEYHVPERPSSTQQASARAATASIGASATQSKV